MTMLLRLPYCLMNRHRADKASVKWNGTRHVGTCRDCGKPVRKSGRGLYWRLLDPLEVPSSQ